MKKAIFGTEGGKFKAILTEPIDGRYLKEQEILKKYWFFHPERSVKTGLMCFGFECDEGWYYLIEQLCHDIEQLIDKKYPDYKTCEYPFEVLQVKEKFGGLRFYTSGSNDEIENLIDKAEKLSYKTCEVCGAKGKLRDYGWLKTMCNKCYKELCIKRKLKRRCYYAK